MTDAKRRTRIDALFEGLRARGEKALITFITAGDPDLKSTVGLILELERSGADMIELGIPFSDPMADGPTIQASSERAVKRGVTVKSVLDAVTQARKKSSIPIVLFGYYNPILQYGLAGFAKDASRAGADGVLVVDLPPEEAGELKAELDKVGMDLIFLLTPTSDEGRMKLVASKAAGFIYFVSVTGVTGARNALSSSVEAHVRRARRHTKLPIGVGFGISTPKQAREVCNYADAAVVGSALVKTIHEHSDGKDLLATAGRFVSELKGGVMAASRAKGN